MKIWLKTMSAFLAVAILLSLTSVLSPTAVNAAEINSLEESLVNSESCVEFIEENFERVISEYNAAHTDAIECKATSIEGRTLIYLTDVNKYGFYLDFNDDNGYLLVTEDYTLYEFEPIGELEYLKGVESAFYNSFDGFMYCDLETGCLERYVYLDTSSQNIGGVDATLSVAQRVEENNAHDGQHSDGGDGKIYDIDAYVADAYPEYEYVGRHIIPNYQWIYQWNTSVYQSDDGSEGNCVINATYSMMNNWISRGRYTSLPTGTTNYNNLLTSDELYNPYGNGTRGTWRANSTSTLRVMPTLYLELREYAIDYGYLPDAGMQSKYIIKMVENVAADHGYSINMASSSSFTNAKSELNANRACVLSVGGSSTFGNHAMGLYGYVEYSYTSGWWIFESTKTAYFYVVDDGHMYKRNDSNYSYTSGGVTYPVSYFDPNTDANPSLTFFYED